MVNGNKDAHSAGAAEKEILIPWYEIHESAESAIVREKQIKKWKRAFISKSIQDAFKIVMKLTFILSKYIFISDISIQKLNLINLKIKLKYTYPK